MLSYKKKVQRKTAQKKVDNSIAPDRNLELLIARLSRLEFCAVFRWWSGSQKRKASNISWDRNAKQNRESN
jgi:hypothetical protein